MSGSIARIEELGRYPIEGQDGLTWRPVRRHFDIQAFGVNAYTAEEAGQRVVEEHREEDGHEELYVVVSGRATFTFVPGQTVGTGRSRHTVLGRGLHHLTVSYVGDGNFFESVSATLDLTVV